ncbi:MAG: YihA family ribosome biogenesis GTP-binding protein [Magnetococcales bacterium]|nr:YihA family ribosome biogenesis GTP-binding protein [Magnetococcales bacterium]PPR14953.1 MAG: putative GTP-binding protein EngB [Pseudomonadota bacterium]
MSKAVKSYFKGDVQHIWGTEVAAVAFPPETLPEVAFIGRSNVGKSSLINALMNRNKLARTSSNPGATKGVHFFQVNDDFILVDLPGYGYAKVSKELSFKIARMTEEYFSSRRSLKRVYVLVDGRHGLKESDQNALSLLTELGIQTQIILTKMDKVRGKAVDKVIQSVQAYIEEYHFVDEEILKSSSDKGFGLDEIKSSILKACEIVGA